MREKSVSSTFLVAKRCVGCWYFQSSRSCHDCMSSWLLSVNHAGCQASDDCSALHTEEREVAMLPVVTGQQCNNHYQQPTPAALPNCLKLGLIVSHWQVYIQTRSSALWGSFWWLRPKFSVFISSEFKMLFIVLNDTLAEQWLQWPSVAITG